MTHLSLVHIEELDIRAIAIITNSCPNLISFGLHNCEFVQPRDVVDDDERDDADGPFRDVDRSARSQFTSTLFSGDLKSLTFFKKNIKWSNFLVFNVTLMTDLSSIGMEIWF